MTKLKWGLIGQRFYEAGADRGVLFVENDPGVPWNGLISVKENPSGGEPTPYYVDGFKYINVSASEEFEASLSAFSAPSEFNKCDGIGQIHNGLYATEQPRQQFNLTYRTMVGNDVSGINHGYKIHLVYNALAAPSARTRQTLGNSAEPGTLEWALTTMAVASSTMKPTAHLVIDSTDADPQLLAILEGYLYGAEGISPTMPTQAEIIAMFGDWVTITDVETLQFLGVNTAAYDETINLVLNPRAVAGVTNITASGAYTPADSGFKTGDLGGAYPTFYRIVKNGSGAVALSIMAEDYVPGETYTAMFMIKSSVSMIVNVAISPVWNNSSNNLNLGANINLVAGETVFITRTGVAPAVVPGSQAGIRIRDNGVAPTGTIIEVSGLTLVAGTYLGSAFDGSMAEIIYKNQPAKIHWAGAANNSVSIMETNPVLGPNANDGDAWLIGGRLYVFVSPNWYDYGEITVPS